MWGSGFDCFPVCCWLWCRSLDSAAHLFLPGWYLLLEFADICMFSSKSRFIQVTALQLWLLRSAVEQIVDYYQSAPPPMHGMHAPERTVMQTCPAPELWRYMCTSREELWPSHSIDLQASSQKSGQLKLILSASAWTTSETQPTQIFNDWRRWIPIFYFGCLVVVWRGATY